MMKRALYTILLCVLLQALCGAAELVILDIGHSTKDKGASSPDGRLTETAFWYKNVGEVKRLIEAGGYRCIVCNRCNAPMQKPLAGVCQGDGGGTPQ